MLRQLVAVASVVLLLAAMAPHSAVAQADTDDTTPRWTQTFVPQAKALLESGTADMQAQAMQLIVEFSRRPAYAISFDELRPSLYDILLVQSNPDNLRILALSALHATGPAPSPQMLATSVQDETSQRVRRFMLLTLHAQQ